ncbi:uncharacterized protein METZ01_LOCUS27056 [marine metagenome]|uniref:Uncharacterized protein n=1 Tax=marine metagenome TaxID=408172 RepID=A0A381Q4F5_9ZZZZ
METRGFVLKLLGKKRAPSEHFPKTLRYYSMQVLFMSSVYA